MADEVDGIRDVGEAVVVGVGRVLAGGLGRLAEGRGGGPDRISDVEPPVVVDVAAAEAVESDGLERGVDQGRDQRPGRVFQISLALPVPHGDL